MILLVALLIALAATYRVWLPLPGKFLTAKDDVAKADCIVPLGGGEYFRFKKAAELYNNGYSERMVFSVVPDAKEDQDDFYNFARRLWGLRDLRQKDYAMRAFKYFGVNTKDVYLTGATVTSTFEDAEAAREYLTEKGYKSCIIVTSNYHMRRALIIFWMVFRGSGIKIYHSSAADPGFDAARWWTREKYVKTMAEEYLSIAYNILYHFVLGKKRTSFDTV